MSTKKELELFLYKNKLNETSLIDILDVISTKTANYLLNDLKVLTAHTNFDSERIFVFTDGNCKKNGKQGAKAGYAVYFTDDEDSKYFPFNVTSIVAETPTNQKAELLAMKKLFEIVQDNHAIFHGKTLVVVTDSMYALKCVSEWSKTWASNGWKTTKGEPVKNGDIIRSITQLYENIKQSVAIVFKHVFSHVAEPQDKSSMQYFLWYGNNKVDDMINVLLG